MSDGGLDGTMSHNLLSTLGLLICTLISESQGLQKSRSVSNLRKSSGPVHLDIFQFSPGFFFSLPPGFFSGLCYKSSFFLGGDLEKNSGLQDLKFF